MISGGFSDRNVQLLMPNFEETIIRESKKELINCMISLFDAHAKPERCNCIGYERTVSSHCYESIKSKTIV